VSIATIDWHAVVSSTGLLLGAALLGLVVHFLLFQTLARIPRGIKTQIGSSLFVHCRRPSRFLLPLIGVGIILPQAPVTASLLDILQHALTLCYIALGGWFVAELISVAAELVLTRYDVEAEDNLYARKVHTRIRVVTRIVVAILGVLVVAMMLLTFEGARHLGTSILASAGIAGIIIGLAAQRSIGTLLAGLQIAITQPISIDDVVIVENEWGRIEEINLTYAVVKIWDQRRLVVPITYFIETPFQNWTKRTADILGTVYLYLDYTAPVQALREELHRIVEGSQHWDGRVWGLQVTNATEHTLELRALVSASDASKAWSLRCEVREKLIEFVQHNYPQSLPRMRAGIDISPREPTT
jgi:small-conductance mechanosensitive channel